MKQFAEKQSVPGFSVAVAVNGKIVWSEGYGFANLETETPAFPRTIYRIGSVTKLFTAAAVLRLLDQGRINLDSPIQKYVPQFPEKPYPINVRQLAGHVAGIRHYRGSEFFNPQRVASVVESLARFKDDPLLFEPGTKYAYSSYGFVLLGAAVEGASGQDFATALRETVFAPLGMESTIPDFAEQVVHRRGGFYVRTRNGVIQNGASQDTTDRLPAGGYLSSVEDLARFGSAFTGDPFLAAGTRALVLTPQKTTDGKETGVGLGWRVGKDKLGRLFLHHGGDSMGGRAFLLVYREQKVVVAFAANLSFAPFNEQQAIEIASFFLDH